MATTKKATAAGQRQQNSAPTSDPLNIKDRLYNQIGKLLDDLERADRDEVMTQPQRVSALIAVGRVLTIFASLKKGEFDYGNSGAAVRKYASIFSAAHDPRSREANPRSSDAFGLDSSSDEYDS